MLKGLDELSFPSAVQLITVSMIYSFDSIDFAHLQVFSELLAWL